MAGEGVERLGGATMTHRTEWPDYDDEARALQAHITSMIITAQANGFEVITCIYNGIFVPVLQEIADSLGVVEGQELTDGQMLDVTEAMIRYNR